jgi:hypothetical protein
VNDKRPPRTASAGDVTRKSARSPNLLRSLGGKLIAFPRPDRPGYWVYRELEDGSLLETELAREEWHRLLEEDLARKNARVDVLNQHPLNVAALGALRRAREGAGGQGSLRWLHVLSLASLGLPCEEGKEDEPPWSDFIRWTENVSTMEAALCQLEEAGVTADDVSCEDPEAAAQMILCELEVRL